MLFKKLCIVALLVLLSGCGFHLRGENNLTLRYQQLQVTTPHPYSHFTRALKTMLQRNNVEISNQAPHHLKITQVHFYHDTPTIGTSAIARVYRFTLDVDYELTHHGHVSASRFTTLNPGTLISTNNQITLLEDELIEDVIRKLLVKMGTKPE